MQWDTVIACLVSLAKGVIDVRQNFESHFSNHIKTCFFSPLLSGFTCKLLIHRLKDFNLSFCFSFFGRNLLPFALVIFCGILIFAQ